MVADLPSAAVFEIFRFYHNRPVRHPDRTSEKFSFQNRVLLTLLCTERPADDARPVFLFDDAIVQNLQVFGIFKYTYIIETVLFSNFKIFLYYLLEGCPVKIQTYFFQNK